MTLPTIRDEPSTHTLQEIGTSYNCDKFTRHDFGPIYERFFSPLREKSIKILEIGIGGEDFAPGGESLKTWQDYFPNAQIFGIDIYPKATLDTQRIHTFVCSQTDRANLHALAAEHGPFDVIIDDGSHHNDDAAVSFEVLFPSLRRGGIYVIEDVQTSYWANYGGSSIAPDCFSTAASWLKRSIDVVNRGEFVIAAGDYSSAELDIGELHVFHNIAVLVRQEDPTSHLSRVLTPEMKADVAQIDAHRHGKLRSLFSKIGKDPSYLGEILMATATILEGARTGEKDRDGPSSTRPTSSALIEIFGQYHDAVLNLTKYVSEIEREKADFLNAADRQIGYSRELEREKETLINVAGNQAKYAAGLENEKSNLIDTINKQTEYVRTIEVHKAALETELLAHSKALRDYERSVADMRVYIASLEERLKPPGH